MENLPELFTETKQPAKAPAHGQGETGNANRNQAVEYLEALVPGFVDQFEDIEALHAEMYMKQFMDYLRQKWGVVVLAFLLAPMVALGQAYEVKGEFKNHISFSSGDWCGCLTRIDAVKICCAPFDCKVNAAGEIYCKTYCDVGASCNTFDGTAWVQSDCCYWMVGRKDEQCVCPLPLLSFFKISRQVYRA